jgi:hypothetical protein
MDSTIAGSMNDNINMDSIIAESMNDNINMDTINQLNPATFFSLSQAKTWISNFTCHVLFVFSEFS